MALPITMSRHLAQSSPALGCGLLRIYHLDLACDRARPLEGQPQRHLLRWEGPLILPVGLPDQLAFVQGSQPWVVKRSPAVNVTRKGPSRAMLVFSVWVTSCGVCSKPAARIQVQVAAWGTR